MMLRISMGLGDHIEYRGRTWGSSSTLGTHRSCGNEKVNENETWGRK